MKINRPDKERPRGAVTIQNTEDNPLSSCKTPAKGYEVYDTKTNEDVDAQSSGDE